jgi:hypothetical protein
MHYVLIITRLIELSHAPFTTLRLRLRLSVPVMVAISSRSFPPGSTPFWAFVFLVFLLISSSYDSTSTTMPHCVKDCNHNFANDAALSRHRKACPVLKAVRERSQDLRRDRGIGGLIQNTTFVTRKQHLQVSDAL